MKFEIHQRLVIYDFLSIYEAELKRKKEKMFPKQKNNYDKLQSLFMETDTFMRTFGVVPHGLFCSTCTYRMIFFHDFIFFYQVYQRKEKEKTHRAKEEKIFFLQEDSEKLETKMEFRRS